MRQRSTMERELKLDAPAGFRLDDLGGEVIVPKQLTSIYYDTPERRLFESDITLRRRIDDGRAVWQLKLPRADGRLELEVADGGDDAPESFVSLLRNVVGGEPLEPFATLHTNRSGRRVDGVEVTLDETRVAAEDPQVESFTEIEAELVHGNGRKLQRVGKRLEKLGARPAAYRTKVERALLAPGPREKPGPLRERPRRLLAEQLAELRRHEPGARLGDDPEDVHKMRVAVRRLRSMLRRADAPTARRLRDELGWIGDALGDVRDADVLSAHLRDEAASMSGGDGAKIGELLRPLHRQRRDAHAALTADLESERYGRLLSSLEAAVDDPAFDLPRKALRRAARKEFRSAVKGGELTPKASAPAIHKRRIRVKRARYLAELGEPIRPKQLAKLTAASERLQDVLGEHQDAVVARRKLRELALQAVSKDAALLAGRLIEREDLEIARARGAIPKHWRRFEKAGRRAFS
jgi:CHAD domain-containing protein